MPAPRKPDFSKMTEDDIRENISRLNRAIRVETAKAGTLKKRFWIASGASAAGIVALTVVLPPVGIFAAGAAAAACGAGGGYLADRLDNLAEMKKRRAAFKTVWRARAGRPYRDVQGRLRQWKKRGPRR
jgi:hypothetical protein